MLGFGPLAARPLAAPTNLLDVAGISNTLPPLVNNLETGLVMSVTSAPIPYLPASDQDYHPQLAQDLLTDFNTQYSGGQAASGGQIVSDSTTGVYDLSFASDSNFILGPGPVLDGLLNADVYYISPAGVVGPLDTIVFSGTPDVTAPILTNPTGTETGTTTATGTVSTNEGAGTLYYLISQNATESVATVKAGSSQAVSTTGVQNVSFTGLTDNTQYYVHYVHTDPSANDSSRVSSPAFTTEEIPDVTPPVLSTPLVSSVGAAIASGTVVTDEDNGTLYYIATLNVTENLATIKTGSTKVVSSAGIQTVNVTGLTPETTYYLHYAHTDAAGNDSNVVSTTSFLTLEASIIPATNRSSVNKIADYLRTTGSYAHVQTNEIVYEWLVGEGVGNSQLNGMLYKYLVSQGYTGTLQDMMYKWSKSP